MESNKMATSRAAIITFLEPGDPQFPDNSLPGQPVYPGNALPGRPTYPSNELPGGGHISLLPVYPFDPTRPDAGLPPSGGNPDQGLPRPGKKFVVKWLACQGLILYPDNALPTTPPPTTDNTLPETPEPK